MIATPDILAAVFTGLFLAAVGGYVIGSVPFGLILTALGGYGDIRTVGSGNIGATNVLRTGSKFLAVLTLILDATKGAIAVIVFGHIFGGFGGWVAGMAALVGHIFPIWLKFKGGKGVATALGVLLAAYWPIGIAVCLTWLGSAVIFRISSLSALIAAATAPLWALVLKDGQLAAVALVMAALVIFRHAANIHRLWRGEEPRIGKSTPSSS